MADFSLPHILYQLREASIYPDMTDDELNFFKFCLKNLPKSKAQNLQDLWIMYEHYNRTVNPGIFVDFGATNGIDSNNSYILEEMGWRGIVCEPNPIWHDKLKENRKCYVDYHCVAPKSGETVNFICTEEAELSTMSEYVNSDYNYAKRKYNTTIKHITTISLDDLVQVYAGTDIIIDYLSIDTEGSEYDILKAYSFKVPFKLITVEHNFNQTSREKIHDLLVDRGYERKFEKFSRWDDFYKLKGRENV
jgi:FkbM family methyltransferase